MCSTMQDIGQKDKNAVIWLGGYLNLPDIKWNTCSVDGSQNPAQINNKFLDAAQNNLKRGPLESQHPKSENSRLGFIESILEI